MPTQTSPFVFFRGPPAAAPPTLKATEKAWHFFALRLLMAVAMQRHPVSQVILEQAYRQGLCDGAAQERATSGSATRTTTQTGESSSSSSASKQRPLSSMTKEELEHEARAHGLDVRGATASMLKVILRQLRAEDRPQKASIPGLSSMKKANLQALAAERGIPNSASMTVEELRLRLQGWSPEAATATGKVARPPNVISGSDVVAFGRWKGSTYREVLAMHRSKDRGSYASWVVTQSEQTDVTTSPDLRRLAKYLKAHGVNPADPEEDPGEEEVEIEPEAETEGHESYNLATDSEEDAEMVEQPPPRRRFR